MDFRFTGCLRTPVRSCENIFRINFLYMKKKKLLLCVIWLCVLGNTKNKLKNYIYNNV